MIANSISALFRALVVLDPKDGNVASKIAMHLGVTTSTQANVSLPPPEAAMFNRPEELATAEHGGVPTTPHTSDASVLVRIKRSSSHIPEWMYNTQPLPRAEPEHDIRIAHGGHLFEDKWLRALITAISSRMIHTGDVDVDRLVEICCSQQPIESVPRYRVRAVASVIVLLIDSAQIMMPFGADVATLEESFSRIIGNNRIIKWYFRSCPMQGVSRTLIDTFMPWRDTIIPPRSNVVCISSLGAVFSGVGEKSCGSLDWLQLLASVRRRSGNLILITPFGKDRWPAILAKKLSILIWERQTTVSEALQLASR